MDRQGLPHFADAMVADLNRQIDESESKIRAEQEKVQSLMHTKCQVLKQYAQSNYFVQRTGRMNRRAASLEDCPISGDEMRELGDRHSIVRAIAERDSQDRVHVPSAARWLNRAGIVATMPASLTKTLVRAMRKQPTIWTEEGQGWFRLTIPQQEQGSSYTHAEPNSFETQEYREDMGDNNPHAKL